MFKHIIAFLLVALLTACGGGGGSSSTPTSNPTSTSSSSISSESVAPLSLNNSKITLTETAVTNVYTGIKQASTGITTLNFDSTRVTVKTSDGRTLPSIYGYSQTVTGNTVLVFSLNGGDGYRFDFAFNNKNAGTFRETYTGFDGTQFLYEGN